MTTDVYLARLHAAGWSVGEAQFATAAGLVWEVDGRNGECVILARAATQTAVWRLAVEQAAAVGMRGG